MASLSARLQIVPADDTLASELAGVIAHPPPAPSFRQACGIVICAGGWRYFPSLYVTVRMIRRTGCRLPVQVWYLGDHHELDPRMGEMLAGQGVEWIDGSAVWRGHAELMALCARVDDGLMLKSLAACYSPFAEVLCLDADSYPVANPEALLARPEYRQVGAAFWPGREPLDREVCQRVGLGRADHLTIDPGQFVVDKRRHWLPLSLSLRLCAQRTRIWKPPCAAHGCYALAWRLSPHELVLVSAQSGWETHSFIHCDFDGRPLFVHRTADKFRLPGAFDGAAIACAFPTSQVSHQNQFCPRLPEEASAFQFLQECDERLRPELHFDTLNDPGYLCEWVRCNRENVYRFADVYPEGSVAIDVGANVGGAAFALLSRGIGRVVCVEPDPRNFAALQRNLARFVSRVDLHNVAAGPNSDHATVAMGTVPCRSLDSLIDRAAETGRERINVLKLRIDGAEFPCLYASTRLHLVDAIVGEYHSLSVVPDDAKTAGFPEYTRSALMDYLVKQGFAVETLPYAADHGLFWARRSN
jgi:FkbM family methyltransferase